MHRRACVGKRFAIIWRRVAGCRMVPALGRERGGIELFEDKRPGQNAPEFTVTEMSGAVRRVFEAHPLSQRHQSRQDTHNCPPGRAGFEPPSKR